MKKIILLNLVMMITVLWFNNKQLNAQTNNKIKASFKSMTVADPAGGRWIWGKSVAIGDTISILLEGDTNTYDVPWCSSYGCCDLASYNGMSISLHTIIADSCYRVSVAGGLSGGRYFTEGNIIIPPEWVVDSIENTTSNYMGSVDSVIGNRIYFRSGIDYEGCVCSDCGRANLNYYISRNLTLSATQYPGEKDLYSVYPNPATQMITVENRSLKTHFNEMIYIYNSQSRLVMRHPATNAKTEIDISSLGSGIYIVRVKGDGTNYTKKLIIE